MTLRSRQVALCLACMLASRAAVAGGTAADDLVGLWRIASADVLPVDGGRAPLYGPAPKGLLVLDRDGCYSLQILGVAGREGDAHFGRYSVDAEGRTLTFHPADGPLQARRYSLVGDSLLYVVPAPTGDPFSNGEVEWRRTAKLADRLRIDRN